MKGYEKDKFTYASILDVTPDTTYVMRSIAYRGVSARNVNGIVFNELDFDKRKDVVIAFRVVQVNEGKDVTIIWKELDDNKAPKLEAPK